MSRFILCVLVVILAACQGESSDGQSPSKASGPEKTPPGNPVEDQENTSEPDPEIEEEEDNAPEPEEIPPIIETPPSFGFESLGIQYEGYSILSSAFRLSNINNDDAKHGVLLKNIHLKEGGTEIGALDFSTLQEIPATSIDSDVYIVIDIGSSFSKEEIESIKISVQEYAKQYLSLENANKKISIIAFDSSNKYSLELTNDPSEVESFISTINSDIANRTNSTNWYGAFEAIMTEVDVKFTNEMSKYDTVLLITDGLHNSDSRNEEYAKSLIVNNNNVKKSIIPLVLKDVDTKTYFDSQPQLYSKALYGADVSALDNLLVQAQASFDLSKMGIYRVTYLTPKRQGINSLSVSLINIPVCEPLSVKCRDALEYEFNADGFEDTPPMMEVASDAEQGLNNIYYVDDDTTFKLMANLKWAHGEYDFSFTYKGYYEKELTFRSQIKNQATYYVPAGFARGYVQVSEEVTGLKKSVAIYADIDKDGHYNSQDDLPYNPDEHLDTDKDGIGNNADLDDDNDLFSDEVDQYPLDKDKTIDIRINLRDLSPSAQFYRNQGVFIPLDGYSMDRLGDVNGDGFADVIIGRAGYSDRHYNSNGTSYAREGVGRAYIIYGRSDLEPSTIPVSDEDSINGLIYQGSERYKYIGYSVAGVGDIDGDGKDDLAIGTRSNSNPPSFLYHSGRTYFITSNTLKGVRTLYSSKGYSGVGYSVKPAGDVNGNGQPDIVIESNSGSYDNQIIISYGDGGLDMMTDINDMPWNAGYKISSNYSLTPFAGLGDINGDGFDDLRFRDNNGVNSIVWGRRYQSGTLDIDDLASGKVFTLTGGSILNVNPIDINNDGINDIVVSSNNVTKIIYGKPSGFTSSTIEEFMSNEGVMISARNIQTVEYIPDFNGDGIKDLLIEARGILKLIYGKRNWTDDIPYSEIKLEDGIEIFMWGAGGGNYYSKGIGDFNGDGFGDVMVGRSNSGEVFIKFGFAQPEQDLSEMNP